MWIKAAIVFSYIKLQAHLFIYSHFHAASFSV